MKLLSALGLKLTSLSFCCCRPSSTALLLTWRPGAAGCSRHPHSGPDSEPPLFASCAPHQQLLLLLMRRPGGEDGLVGIKQQQKLLMRRAGGEEGRLGIRPRLGMVGAASSTRVAQALGYTCILSVLIRHMPVMP